MRRKRENRPTPAEFSAYLRAEREQKALTLAEISRITKVPTPSLQCLEEADFDKLPAEVFVRGFLRSYAKCVGLDPEDVVRRYVDARDVEPEPVPQILTEQIESLETEDDADDAIEVDSELPPRGESTTRSRLRETGQFVARQLFANDVDDKQSGPRRGAVTLAVIILVIVATLTMSYLLRRPSSSGDGVTMDDSIGASERRHTV